MTFLTMSYLIRLPYLLIYTEPCSSLPEFPHYPSIQKSATPPCLDGSIITGSNLTNRFLAKLIQIHPFPPDHLYDGIGPIDFSTAVYTCVKALQGIKVIHALNTALCKKR